METTETGNFAEHAQKVKIWQEASDDMLMAQVKLDSPDWINPFAVVSIDEVRAIRVAYERLASLMQWPPFVEVLLEVQAALDRFETAAQDLECNGDESPWQIVGRAIGAVQLYDLSLLLEDWASVAAGNGVEIIDRASAQRWADEAGVTIPPSLNPEVPKALRQSD